MSIVITFASVPQKEISSDWGELQGAVVKDNRQDRPLFDGGGGGGGGSDEENEEEEEEQEDKERDNDPGVECMFHSEGC